MEAVVVEPRATPVDKACGEGLMPTGAEALRSLGVRPDGWPLRGIAYLDAAGSVTAPFPAVCPGSASAARSCTRHSPNGRPS